MRKERGFLLISILLCISLTSGFSGSGAGTSGDPFQITNCTQLQEINDSLSSHYILTQDIDCSDTVNWNNGSGFYPIGRDPYMGAAFTGTFDGKGYDISNLFINRTGYDYAALFGGTSISKIENVGLIDVNIFGERFSSLVGAATYTNITNCFATGHLEVVGTSVAWSGGINGWIEDGNIVNCYFIGTIEGKNNSRMGGITSNIMNGEIINSYFKGNLSGNNSVGGLISTAGWAGTSSFVNIVNSYVIGNIEGPGNYIGGLVGESDFDNIMSITDSYFIGNVTSQSYAAGLVGMAWEVLRINNSYVIGNITSKGDVGGLASGWYGPFYIKNTYFIGNIKSSGGYVGGLFSGVDEINLEDSYFKGKITSTGNYVGGIIGWYGSSPTAGGNITNCYADANITAGSYLGGIAGWGFKGNIVNSYFIGNLSGINYVGGLVGENDNGNISNSFSTASIYGSSSLGGLVGTNTGTITNSYWYNSTDDADQCYSGGNTGCNLVDEEYYFSSYSNAPISSWSFPPWDTICNGYGYPSLVLEGISSASQCTGNPAPATAAAPAEEEEEERDTRPRGTPIFRPSSQDLSKGYKQTVIKRWKIRFESNNEEHLITVRNITENKITLIIQSNEKIVNILINETKKVDLDDDGYYDLQILLTNIWLRKADLVLTSIHEEILEEEVEKIGCEIDTDCPQGYNCTEGLCNKVKERKNYLGYIFTIIIIVIMIAMVIDLCRPKRKRKIRKKHNR